MENKLRDTQRVAYERLLNNRLAHVIEGYSGETGDYKITCKLFPIDRDTPITENGTDYYVVRAEFCVENMKSEGSVSFYVDLLKLPVLYELGFKIGGNYMQMLDSYERTTGWSFGVVNKGERFSVVTAKALAAYGKTFSFIYNGGRSIFVDFSRMFGKKSTAKGSVDAGVFIRAISGLGVPELVEMFGNDNPFVQEIFCNPKKYLPTSRNECIEAVAKAIFDERYYNSLSTTSMKQKEIDRWLFSGTRFDLGVNNRKRFESTQSFQNRAGEKLLGERLEINGVVYEEGITLTPEILEVLDASPISELKVMKDGKSFNLKKFSNLTFRAYGAKLLHDVPEAGLVRGQILGLSELHDLNESDVSSIKVSYGANKIELNRRTSARSLTKEDIYTAFSMWLDNLNGLGIIDKQYELTNRVCVSFDDLICDYVGKGMSAVVTEILGHASLLDQDDLMASVIADFSRKINLNEFIERIKNNDKGGGQMAEMCNIVSYISKSNKVYTKINPDNITPEMVAVQDLQEGRLDPFDVPESNRIGSVHNKTLLSEGDDAGYVVTPFLKVKDGKVVSDEPVYLSAVDELDKYIAAWDETFTDENGNKKESVRVRCNGKIISVAREKVMFKEYSNIQTMSATHAMVTFAGHSNAKRITMSCNQQRQAMVTVNTERPFVGTGIESVMDFGTYKGSQVLQTFYDGYVTLAPEIAKYRGRILNSDLRMLRIISGKDTRTFEFEVEEMTQINAELNTQYDAVTSLTVPYHLRNFNEGVFSYRLNHVQGRIYSPNDVIAYNTGYSLKKFEREDLIDFGGYDVDPACFDKGLAMGQNMLVGYKTCLSSTTDDAILLSDSCIYTDKLTHLRVFLKEVVLHSSDGVSEQFGSDDNTPSYIDHRGLPRIGTVLRPGDKYAAILTKKKSGNGVKYSRLSAYEEGQVVNADIVTKNEKTVMQVLFAYRASIEPGDKMAGRHGNKGVVAQILPSEQMPFDPKTGRTLDICLNPLGVPSRQNISQLIELVLGMCRLIDGKQSYVSPYHKDDLKFVQKQAKKFDIKPMEMIDGRTGKPFKRPINVGVLYMYKMQQTAVSGIHAIGLDGPVDPVFLQPKKGAKRNGGQSFGEMENWCLHGVGATMLLRDLYGLQSDDVEARELFKAKVHDAAGVAVNTESINCNDAVILSLLRSLGVTLVTKNDEYSLEPLTDDKILALSPTPVRHASELHSSAIFGKDSSSLQKHHAKNKWSWIDLGTEIIHPLWLYKNVFGSYVTLVGDFSNYSLSKDYVKAILNGEISIACTDVPGEYYMASVDAKHSGATDIKYFKDRIDSGELEFLTGMKALVMVFKTLDLKLVETNLEKQIEARIANANKKVSAGQDRYNYASDKHKRLITKLANVRSFNQAGMTPRDYIITKFPVMPTTFRPMIQMEQRGNSDADFDYYYKQILAAVKDVENNESNTTVLALYERIRDFVGIGNSDSKQRYKNVMNYFVGTDSSDHGKVRSAAQSKRIFCSGRATITPANYRISPMQLGVPASMLVTIGAEPLSAYIIAKATNTSPSISTKKWQRIFMSIVTGNFDKFRKIWTKNADELASAYGMRADVAFTIMKQWIVDFFEGNPKEGTPPQIVIAGRQPSLHRYSIRAYSCVVLWSKTIQINSLNCKGYNADFDGDKMWLTLAMTADAREDAISKITPASDMINPKNSSIMLEHTQDIALGCYVATMLKDNAAAADYSLNDAYYYDSLSLLENDVFCGIVESYDLICFNMVIDGESSCYLSTAGRILFNALLDDAGFTEKEFTNPLGITGVHNHRFKELGYDGIITCGKGGDSGIRYFNLQDICKTLYLDNSTSCIDIYYEIELFGFKFSDLYGVSISINDMEIDSNKNELLAEAASKKLMIEQDFQNGLISVDDKQDAIRAIYTSDEFGVNPKIEKNLLGNLSRNNNLFIMMDSGARGNKTQIMHMCGSIGVLEKSKTEIMDDAITSNYFEGLDSFDVHMASYSARTGVASTQRETRNAGYATRKAVYMLDGSKIVANDCGKSEWWYDAIWDDRIDSMSYFKPSRDWFELNVVGRSINGQTVTENDYGEYSKGFNYISFDDGAEPAEIVAEPYVLVGSRLVDAEGEKYFSHLIDDEGRFNGSCADALDRYKLREVTTSAGTFVCRYKLHEACRSQLMYREARDLPKLKTIKDLGNGDVVNYIDEDTLDAIEIEGIDKIPARVMLDCKCHSGICAHCYGLKYSNLRLPEVGEIVGTESAQAIGEPSAQLTMNVINKGGAGGASIASGIDVFNAYLDGSIPGGSKSEQATVPQHSGYVRMSKLGNSASVCIEPLNKDCAMCQECMLKNNGCIFEDGRSKTDAYCLLPAMISTNTLTVKNGEWVESGYPITNLPLTSNIITSVKDSTEPRLVLRHKQMIWILNYFNVFMEQSVSINVRHFELLAFVQNQYVTVVKSQNPQYKLGEIYNVSEVDLTDSSVEFSMSTLSMSETIKRNSGLLAALTFAEQLSTVAEATVSNYRSSFKDNSSPVGLITVGQDLTSTEMKQMPDLGVKFKIEEGSLYSTNEGPTLIELETPEIGIQLNEMDSFSSFELTPFDFSKPETEAPTTETLEFVKAEMDFFGAESGESEEEIVPSKPSEPEEEALLSKPKKLQSAISAKVSNTSQMSLF